ncbi:MAG: hypothetical protein LBK53_00105 [Heliobacteriaceae bacterium]|jgi:hypothetical protein|nr:hypothetical protein [Heliobacteriaceae bacterium]
MKVTAINPYNTSFHSQRDTVNSFLYMPEKIIYKPESKKDFYFTAGVVLSALAVIAIALRGVMR